VIDDRTERPIKGVVIYVEGQSSVAEPTPRDISA
jgi:hypothetical protein